MEFGKLEDISGVDWILPPDDSRNKERLSSPSHNKIFIGSPAWGCKYWTDKIYPKGTPTEKFLYHYSRNFTCIELNTTHYRIPDETTCKEWLAETPDHFLFCPKVNKEISHNGNGILDKDLLKVWTKFLGNLGDRQGPGFIQFHEKFSYMEKHLLFKFLENWPKEFRLSIELRHASWYQKNSIIPALVDYLHKKNIGLVITDVAGRRDILHSNLSTDWSMIRLIGNDLDPSDEKRLEDWAVRLKKWELSGLKETYLFIHQPDDIWTIEFAQMAERVFSKAGIPNLPKFEPVKPIDLFSQNWN